jgi:hypothetical protein
MAGGELYGVWVQTITNDTTAANVEKYGEVEDMAEAYRDGFAKDFCDGQTSPTPPRWPDDGMQLFYFYDRESAELVSQFLRGDIQERVAAGSLTPAATPSWIGDLAQMGLDTAAKAALLEGVAEAAAPEIAELTRSQIEGRLSAYIAATGIARPTPEQFLKWLLDQE